MKTIGAIQVDLNCTPLGTRSRLRDELAGVPVLRRTVSNLCEVRSLSANYVIAPEEQVLQCQKLLEGLPVLVLGMACNPPVWTSIVRASRKWSLNGWRGGVGGSTVFDEFTDCRVLSGLLQCDVADAVLSVPPSAVLLDAELAERMIENRANNPDARLTFSPTVPGVAGIVLEAALIREMAAAAIPLSWLFSYKPDEPRKDLIFQKVCLDVPAPLRFATGRLMADTDGAVRRLTSMFSLSPTWNLQQIGEFLLEEDEHGVEPFPREVEIELTADDPFPRSLLVPRGEGLGRTGHLELSLLHKLAAELSQLDDSLCVFGGFGDPLRYPGFSDALQAFKPMGSGLPLAAASVYGLCVRTSAYDLTAATVELLVDHGVDLLSVSVDAWSDDVFRRVKGISEATKPGLSHVLQKLESVSALQRDRKSSVPIMIPDMIKARENVQELDDFFDGWTRRAGAVSITGVSNFAGQLEDRAVIDMRPPRRIACRRLRSRCLVLCDGRVALCDQDFRGLKTVGNIRDASLADIWNSANFAAVRRAHLAGKFAEQSMCASCHEWHRP